MVIVNIPNLVQYYRISALQIVVLLVGVSGLAIINPNGWFEFGLGGLNAIVPYAWFSYRVISKGQVRKSAQMVAMANRGAIEKYILSAAGFLSIFVMLEQSNTLFVFIGFFALLATQMLGAVFIRWPKSIN